MNGHHKRRAGDVLVATMGFDEFEVGLLAVVRHFFTSFAAPESQSWVIAFRLSAERWGISDGAKAACAMLDVADAMRRARPTMFNFSDPNCPICRDALTPNEQHLMCLIHAIRRGRVGDAQTEAMLLTEGAENSNLMRASWVLAGLFPAAKVASQTLLPGHMIATDLRLH